MQLEIIEQFEVCFMGLNRQVTNDTNGCGMVELFSTKCCVTYTVMSHERSIPIHGPWIAFHKCWLGTHPHRNYTELHRSRGTYNVL